MGSKRKRHYRQSEHPRDHYPHPESAKRRRISGDMESTVDDLSSHQAGIQAINKTKDEDGWTIVKSKSSKHAKDGRGHRDRNYDDYPYLTIHQNYKSDIRLKDLRDLGLYLLADEAAPRWTAVGNSRHMKKVVVVMVPGLDEKVLRRAEKVLKERKDTAAISREAKDSKDSELGFAEERPSLITEAQRAEKHRNSQAHKKPRNGEQSQSWLFQNVIQVRSPGDTKMSKVHSPLQAMLLSQGSDKKQENNANGHAAERTAITEFIHLADELREAEFPIHPATFSTQLDAELEATRRERMNQSLKGGWSDTSVFESDPKTDPGSQDFVSQGLSIYSVDCEMVQTSDGASSLARVSLISYPDGKVIIDKYVKPDLPITNYFTQFSGITPEILENVTTTLKDIQKELMDILTLSSVLLGHSLESDLNALKITHPFLIDTSLLYPHPRGLPLRSSLKYLANKYLKREIQTGGVSGHNSVEDAQAVLDLVKLKCEKGPKWGTIEANGEPIFKRLKRNGRTSAMVEYGTPERGFGKDATHTIGCQNDDEVTKGVVRAIKGDDFFDFEIPSGGVEYIWGRLRALEFARGWVSGTTSQPQQAKKSESEMKKTTVDGFTEDKEIADINEIALETLDRLQQIYDALPSKCLLMVCSGTSDIRPVMRLQAQQQQYRKEFKVKKWDELTVKWTDTEEQALRKACEDARAGWAVCTIK